jgi:hypothetical protein
MNILRSTLDIARRAECVAGDIADRASDEVLFGIRPHVLSPLERELVDALRPFANYACSPAGTCACHNCRARDVLTKVPA